MNTRLANHRGLVWRKSIQIPQKGPANGIAEVGYRAVPVDRDRLLLRASPDSRHSGVCHNENVLRFHRSIAASLATRCTGDKRYSKTVRLSCFLRRNLHANWARRLKRVFGIEIEQCARCGGGLRVIASIEEPELTECILAHRRERGEQDVATASLGARAPPQASLF
jgi:hypothetical protein